jgi:hypothetical protein
VGCRGPDCVKHLAKHIVNSWKQFRIGLDSTCYGQVFKERVRFVTSLGSACFYKQVFKEKVRFVISLGSACLYKQVFKERVRFVISLGSVFLRGGVYDLYKKFLSDNRTHAVIHTC